MLDSGRLCHCNKHTREIWDVTDTATAARLTRAEQPCYWEPTIVDARWHGDTVYVASMMTVDLYRWDGTGDTDRRAGGGAGGGRSGTFGV